MSAERFWSKVDKNGPVPAHRSDLGPCWTWTPKTDRAGYGLFSIGPRKVLAHRWAYQSERGPIPVGLTLDHLCRVRCCVNPGHLEPVTHLENVQRAHRGQTHCKRAGHPLTGNNLRFERGHRVCVACARESHRVAQARFREQRKAHAS